MQITLSLQALKLDRNSGCVSSRQKAQPLKVKCVFSFVAFCKKSVAKVFLDTPAKAKQPTETMSRQVSTQNSYRDVLIKLIPSEIIGAFIAIEGIVSAGTKNSATELLSWGAFVALLVLIPFYLRFSYSVLNRRQIWCTMFSFVVWIYSIGGPFRFTSWHDQRAGAVILILWTLVVPIAVRRNSIVCPGDWIHVTEMKQAAVQRSSCLVEWNQGMTEFCGKEAQVMATDQSAKTAKLDIDGGVNDWAFEWVSQKKE